MARQRRPGHGFGDDVPLPTRKLRRRSWHDSTPPGKVRKTAGVLCGVLILALGIGWFVYGTVQFTYRSGLAGTPGRVVVTECARQRDGDRVTVSCHADFVADGPGALVPGVTVEGNTVYPALSGHPARLHADGRTASVVGLSPSANMLSGIFVALLPIEVIGSYGLFLLVRMVLRWRGQVWTPSRRLAILLMWLALGSLALAVAGAITGAAAA